MLLGTFTAAELFLQPSPDLSLHTTVSLSSEVSALACTSNCESFYRQVCVSSPIRINRAQVHPSQGVDCRASEL